MKYAELLKLAKEKVNESLAPMRAREMKKKAELEICKLEAKIAQKEQEIEEKWSAYPIDFDVIRDNMDDLDLLGRQKSQLEKMITERFD